MTARSRAGQSVASEKFLLVFITSSELAVVTWGVMQRDVVGKQVQRNGKECMFPFLARQITPPDLVDLCASC